MIAIAGGKGGCGKTTLALGLAEALVCEGRRPLLVDADVEMPDLHVRAAVDPEPGLAALADGTAPERLARESTVYPGVAVVPAGGTTAVPPAAVEALRSLARPVLIDCPAGAGPDVATPLRAAEACVVVTTADAESRQDAAKTAAMAASLGTPVATTVRRPVRTGQAVAGSGKSPGAARTSAPAGTGGEPVVTVPTVEGDPLCDERVRDSFRRIVRAVWGDEHGRPGSRPSPAESDRR